MDSGSIQSECPLTFNVTGWLLSLSVYFTIWTADGCVAQFKLDLVTHCAVVNDHRYYPIQRPCDMLGNFQQVPAVFDGLVAYKNGVKGAMATQVRGANAASVSASSHAHVLDLLHSWQ